MNENPKAFVLMPFEPEFNSIYEDLIKPALEDAGYDVVRADSFLDQQNILRDIVRGIATADLIIADLTTLNPNVLYELGLSHGLGIPTILLAQSIEDVPFDLRSYRILTYSVRFDQVHKLKQSLKEIGEKHKIREIAFGSPITDFLRLEAHVPRQKATELPPEKPIEEVLAAETLEQTEEEKGFLDFLVEGIEAAGKIAGITSEISEETLNIGNKMEGHTARILALSKNPGLGTAAQVHKIALIVATDMTSYSEQIERKLPGLEKNIDVLSESFSSFIAWIEPKSEEDRKQVAEFRQSITGLLESTKAGLESIRSYRNSVMGLRGISREVNRASRRLAQTLDGVISAMEKVEAFCVRTLPLIDEKLKTRFVPESGTGV